MLATAMYGPGDVRFENVDDPKILKPADAIPPRAECQDLTRRRKFQKRRRRHHPICAKMLAVIKVVRGIPWRLSDAPRSILRGSRCAKSWLHA